MKTLWQRLSKENKSKLKISVKLYPNMSGKLIETLKNEYSWSNLKFELIIWLMQETTNEPTTFENVDKIFDYETIK